MHRDGSNLATEALATSAPPTATSSTNEAGIGHEVLGDGRYRILHQLGAGGAGEVYAALDQELDRRVAIKTLRAAPSDADPDGISVLEHARQSTLYAEARAIASVEHEAIVPVFDVGKIDGKVFWPWSSSMVTPCSTGCESKTPNHGAVCKS